MRKKRKKLIKSGKQKVVECGLCKCNLYETEHCYYLYGKYFCENCVRSAHIELDKKEQCDFDERRIEIKDLREI